MNSSSDGAAGSGGGSGASSDGAAARADSSAGGDGSSASTGCPNGGWGCPELIASYIVPPGDPELAVDADGNAFAVWATYDAGSMSIWSSRFDAQARLWGVPGVLENENTPASEPKVTVDGSGNAIAVWLQNGTVWSNRYDASAGSWGNAGAIESHGDLSYAEKPQIAAGPDGSAFAVWELSDGHIWASRYDPGQGSFGSADMIDDSGASEAASPQVAVDGNGNAIAVFGQLYLAGDRRWHAYANRYDAGNGSWGSAASIEPDTIQGDAVTMRVRTNATGDAAVIWWQQVDSGDHIWASRFSSASSAWATAVPVDNDSARFVDEPHVAIDANGNIFAIWYQDDHAWSTHYDATISAWTAAERIDAGAGWVFAWTDVAADAAGAYAVWTQSAAPSLDSPPTFMVNHYAAGASDWDGQVPISDPAFVSLANQEFGAPRIAIDGSGHAFAVWWQYDGVNFNVWGNRSH